MKRKLCAICGENVFYENPEGRLIFCVGCSNGPLCKGCIKIDYAGKEFCCSCEDLVQRDPPEEQEESEDFEEQEDE